MIQAGAAIDVQDSDGTTALQWAATHGSAEVVLELIQAGATIDAQNDDGCTALLMAATNGELEAVQVLIRAGADIDAQDIDGETATQWAAMNGHTEVVQELTQAFRPKLPVDGAPEECPTCGYDDPDTFEDRPEGLTCPSCGALVF